MVVGFGFGECGDDGNVVTLGTYVVSGRYYGDIDVCYMLVVTLELDVFGTLHTILSSDLRLWDNELQ